MLVASTEGKIIIVRHKHLQKRVLLFLYRFVCLINRKVKLCNERTIHPRASNVVSKLLFFISWQEPNNEYDT